jgi:hypothetical protein
MLFKTILLLFVLSLTSCVVDVVEGFLPDRRSPSGHVLPSLNATSRIGLRNEKSPGWVPPPDSLYVFHYKRAQMPDGPITEGWLFMRFWPNGKFALRSGLLKYPPTAADGDDLEHCIVGNYTSDGNILRTNAYFGHGETALSKWQIVPGGLLRYTPQGFGLKISPSVRYERKSMPGMTRQPDW